MKGANRKKLQMFCLCVAPALLIYTYFILFPFCKTFYYSLTDWNGMTPTYNFVGLKNFAKMFKDDLVLKSLSNNMKFCIVGGIFTFAIAIFNAVVITQSRLRRGEKQFCRVTFFVPNIISTAIVAVIWTFIFNPNWGILNALLEFFHLSDWCHTWLGEKETVVYAVMVPWVWAAVGFYMVMFISAIESIPQDVYDAAKIDGANVWSTFWSVTFPLILETVKTSLVFFFINAFSGVFTLVSIMTNGNPSNASEVITNYMYKQAFARSKFGYSTAIGVFVVLIVFVASGLLMVLTRNKDASEY